MPTSTQSRYIRYLPGIYQDAGDTLAKFLVPFEEQFGALETLLATVDNYMAPGLTPADEFLPWLAGWVALTLDEEWPETTRRRLLCQAVELYRWRGTAQGLRRYLELYTKLPQDQIEIHEAHWPGGMQIGVASRIGGFQGAASPPAVWQVRRSEPPAYRDYYVVDTVAPEGHPRVPAGRRMLVYLDAAQVARVAIGTSDVQVWRRGSTQPDTYAPASITRRNQLIDDVYVLNEGPGQGGRLEYRGDSLLVEEARLPYCFVVRLLVPANRYADLVTPHWLRKVKAIIDLEKPAHTLYYLKVTKFKKSNAVRPMQIGVQSTIGLDTAVI